MLNVGFRLHRYLQTFWFLEGERSQTPAKNTGTKRFRMESRLMRHCAGGGFTRWTFTASIATVRTCAENMQRGQHEPGRRSPMFATFTGACLMRPAHFGKTATSSKRFGTFNPQILGNYSGELPMAQVMI